MAIVDELVAILGYELQGEANVRQFERNLNRAAKQAEVLTQRIAFFGAAADKAFAASRKMLIPSALAIFQAKKIKDAALQTEGWAQGFEAVTGSVEGANEELAFAAERAERYGANLVKVTQNWLKFRAATKGTDVAKDAREIFETFTAVSVRLGQTPDQLDGALKAIEQMVSKGKVQAEELRGQLGERVYGAFIKAAEAMGITTAELDKMLEQGQVVASDLLPKLAKQLQEDYQINLGDRIDTDIATFARLENALYRLRVSIARSGFIDFLADLAAGLTTLVNKIADAPPWFQKLIAVMITLVAVSAPLLWIFGAIARSISLLLKARVGLTALALSIRKMGTAIAVTAGVLKPGWLLKLKPAFGVVATAVGIMTAKFLAIVGAIAAVGLVLNDLWHFLRGGKSAIGEFIKWFKKTDFEQLGENIGGGIVEGIENFSANIDATVEKVTTAIVDTLTNPEFYKAGLKIGWALLRGIRDVGKAIAKAVFNLIVGIFFGIVDKIAGFDVREAGARLAVNIFNSLANAWASLKERALGVFGSIGGWLNEVPFFQMGVDAISRLFDGMKSIGGKIKAWFADLTPEWARDFFGSGSGFTNSNAAENLEGNLNRIGGNSGLTAGSVANVSNRANQKITNSINIEQNVQQPTKAPGQLAKATGAAVEKMMPNRAQLNIEPSQP